MERKRKLALRFVNSDVTVALVLFSPFFAIALFTLLSLW